MHPSVKTVFAATAIGLAALLACGSAQAELLPMQQPDYNAGRARIRSLYAADKLACARLAENTKQACIDKARISRAASRAELRLAFDSQTFTVGTLH